MAPDIGHCISAILQALEDIVLPAMDPAQKAAKEQLHYAMAALKLIAKQHDKAYHLAIAELRLFARLLLRLEAAAGAVIEPDLHQRLTQAAAGKVTDLQAPAQTRLEEIMREYREIADAIVGSPALVADKAARARVAAMVLEHSAEETLMRRGWMATAGVEADLSALPSIEAIIKSAIKEFP